MTPLGHPEETDEIYLLGREDANLKLRFDLLDLKKLVDVEDGLELWAPISKSEFPISTEELHSVFDSVGVDRPKSHRSRYTRDEFLEELATPHPDLEVVHVHKRRVRYSMEGCRAELTSLTANGTETNTIAAESEDPAAVLAAVEKLGLSGYANASYTRGLRCLLGLASARYAVVDIGTNSVKFHIGEQRSDGSWWRVVDRAEVTRIGEGLQEHGDIGPEPLERTLHAVEEMAAEAGENDVLAVTAVGTAALRIASNAAAVIQAMNERTGLSVQVVSGEEESRLAYLAARAGVGLAEGSVVVFDTGGGSSQFTFGRGSEVEERYSLNVGAVSYTERFGLQGAVDEETITQARRALNDDLARLTERPSPDALVGMGGAVTNLAAVSLSLDPYDPDIVQGTVLSSEEIQRQIAMYRSMGAGERASVVGLQPNRALVMLAGALIVAAVLGRLGKETLVVSDRGLRHGLIRERFGLFPPAAS